MISPLKPTIKKHTMLFHGQGNVLASLIASWSSTESHLRRKGEEHSQVEHSKFSYASFFGIFLMV